MFAFIFELPVVIGSEMFTDGADETLASQVVGQFGTLIHLKQGTHNWSRDGPRNAVSICKINSIIKRNNNERRKKLWN